MGFYDYKVKFPSKYDQHGIYRGDDIKYMRAKWKRWREKEASYKGFYHWSKYTFEGRKNLKIIRDKEAYRIWGAHKAYNESLYR